MRPVLIMTSRVIPDVISHVIRVDPTNRVHDAIICQLVISTSAPGKALRGGLGGAVAAGRFPRCLFLFTRSQGLDMKQQLDYLM